MLWNALLLALREIRRNLLRSFLTMLGIVIGVAAVITMVTLGNGATQAVSSQISSLGSNLLMVRPGQRMGPASLAGGAPAFKEADADAVAAQVGGVRAVAPAVSRGATLVYNGRNWSSIATGSTPAYFTTNNWTLASGRVFNDAETLAGASVCLVGATVRRELFASEDPLGAQLRVGPFSCQVIGLLASKGQAAMGQDQDDTVVMPLHTVQRRLTGNTNVSTLLVSVADDADPARVTARIEQLLRERRKLSDADENNFNVLDTKQIAEALSGTTRVMTALLGAVAAVSLLVGGIGIMNIMLVSVTERTREIGVRMALGAKPRNILLQFLIEALMLSIAGGLIGVALGVGTATWLAARFKWPMLIQPNVIIVSVAFSAFVGVVFGLYPARKASQLDPIDALRFE